MSKWTQIVVYVVILLFTTNVNGQETTSRYSIAFEYSTPSDVIWNEKFYGWKWAQNGVALTFSLENPLHKFSNVQWSASVSLQYYDVVHPGEDLHLPDFSAHADGWVFLKVLPHLDFHQSVVDQIMGYGTLGVGGALARTPFSKSTHSGVDAGGMLSKHHATSPTRSTVNGVTTTVGPGLGLGPSLNTGIGLIVWNRVDIGIRFTAERLHLWYKFQRSFAGREKIRTWVNLTSYQLHLGIRI